MCIPQTIYPFQIRYLICLQNYKDCTLHTHKTVLSMAQNYKYFDYIVYTKSSSSMEKLYERMSITCNTFRKPWIFWFDSTQPSEFFLWYYHLHTHANKQKYISVWKVTNCKEQSSFWETKDLSPTEGIWPLLWNPKFHYHDSKHNTNSITYLYLHPQIYSTPLTRTHVPSISTKYTLK